MSATTKRRRCACSWQLRGAELVAAAEARDGVIRRCNSGGPGRCQQTLQQWRPGMVSVDVAALEARDGVSADVAAVNRNGFQRKRF